MKDEQVWRPVDLKQTIVEFQGYRATIYPTIRPDGYVVWGAIVEIVENHMVLVHVPEQEKYEQAYTTVIGAMETFMSGLLGMSKALVAHEEKRLGKDDRKG